MESIQPEPTSRKKVLAIALDYDGCVANIRFELGYRALIEKYGSFKKIPPQVYFQLISQTQELLLKTIADQVEKYDEIMLIVGSNRQSAATDRKNARNQKNGSTFTFLPALASLLQKEYDKPVVVNKTLFFDFILNEPRGYNFDLPEDVDRPVDPVGDYARTGDVKYRTMFLTAHDVCANFPQYDFSFLHFDDRDDIVLPAKRVFENPDLAQIVPSNLLSLQQVQYQDYNPISVLAVLPAIVKERKDTKNYLSDSEIIEIETKIDHAIQVIIKDYIILLKLCQSYQLEHQHDQRPPNLEKEIEAAEQILEKLQAFEFSPASLDDSMATKTEKLFQVTLRLKEITMENVKIKELPPELEESYRVATLADHPSTMDIFEGYQRPANHVGMIIDPRHYPYVAVETYKDDFYQTMEVDLLKNIMAYSKKFDETKSLVYDLLEQEENLRKTDMALDVRQLFKRQSAFVTAINALEALNFDPSEIENLNKRWDNLRKPSWFDCFTYTMTSDPKNLWREAFLFPKKNGDDTGYKWKVAGYIGFMVLGGALLVPLRFLYKTAIETNLLFVENKINHWLASRIQKRITIHPFDPGSFYDWGNYGLSYLAYGVLGGISYIARAVRVASRIVTSPIRSATVGYHTGSEVHPALGVVMALTSGLLSLAALVVSAYFTATAGVGALLTAPGQVSQAAIWIQAAGAKMSAGLPASFSIGGFVVKTAGLIWAGITTGLVGLVAAAREVGGQYIDPEKAPAVAEVVASPDTKQESPNIDEIDGFVSVTKLHYFNLSHEPLFGSTALVMEAQSAEVTGQPDFMNNTSSQTTVLPMPPPTAEVTAQPDLTNNTSSQSTVLEMPPPTGPVQKVSVTQFGITHHDDKPPTNAPVDSKNSQNPEPEF